MMTSGSFVDRLFPQKPPGRRPLAARIAGVLFALAGALLLAGGVFRQTVWVDFPTEVAALPPLTDVAKSTDITYSVHLPDGRIVKTTEAMVPSALKRLHAGEPLTARCRATSDPKCETARAILDRIWLGLAFLITGIGLSIVGRWQQRRLRPPSNG